MHYKGSGLGLFDSIFGKRKIGGEIAFYGLEEWWLTEFTDAERKHIQLRYRPMGSSENDLTEGRILHSSASVVSLLLGMAGWFNKDKDRHLAKRIVGKAESLVNDMIDVLDVHFLYQTKIEVYYRDRNMPGGLDLAIEACQRQINIATQAAVAFKKEFEGGLPTHKGFEQLAIILEKSKNFAEAIALCEKAIEQGWTGDWEKRIQRNKQKADKH